MAKLLTVPKPKLHELALQAAAPPQARRVAGPPIWLLFRPPVQRGRAD